jgi:hypothetical protein
MEKLILKEGKRYKLRNGLITTPLKIDKSGGNYKFEASFDEFPGRLHTVGCWLQGGHYLLRDEKHPNDIVKEFKKEDET